LKSSTSGDPELRIEGSGTDNGIITFLGVGHSNPAVAMRYISTGDSVGHLAFYANASSSSTLSERFRISSDGSLSTPTAGDNNVRFGVNAGNSILDGGNYNVVVGDEAGTAITTGDHNVAVGYNSGASISTGGENTLLGDATGDALDVGTQNVAVGYLALSADTKGSTSTAVGVAALTTQNFTSATNSYNTAVGYDTGGSVTTGKENTLIGGLCGDALTTGSYNTLLGKEAGSYTVNLITGGDNVLIGAYCHTTATDTTRAMVLGYNVQGTTDYTTIGYGTSDIRAAHGNVTWATVSDERYKKDIVDSTAGLSFINALQPRTFKYKTLGELPETFRAYVSPDDEEKDSTEVFKNSKTNHGFIAQEVKAAIDADSSIKDGFRLWDDRDDGSQEVAEAALIPILVKAVQELSTALDAALARITELEG